MHFEIKDNNNEKLAYIIPDRIIMGNMKNGLDLKINIFQYIDWIMVNKINYTYMDT